MSVDKAARMEAMLRKMRMGFLDELPGRCDEIENELLALERQPGDQATFDAIYRTVHSLKGSGGTLGLPIVTNLCHHFETFLTDSVGHFDPDRISRALRHVDLLRQIGEIARRDNPDYGPIDSALEALQAEERGKQRKVLVADPTSLMRALCAHVFDITDVQLQFENDGLVALEALLREPFDLAILARELGTLNGMAVAAAVRLGGGRNQDIPILMVTTNRTDDLAAWRITRIARDQNLPGNLKQAIESQFFPPSGQDVR
jgi:chemotaxis protein histidine kinase CheA